METCNIGTSDDFSGSDQWFFPDEAAEGSAEVVAWAAADRWSSGSEASFVVEPSTGGLMFAGKMDDYTNSLWLAPGGGQLPSALDDDLTNPRSLVAVQQRIGSTQLAPQAVIVGGTHDRTPPSLLTLTNESLAR